MNGRHTLLVSKIASAVTRIRRDEAEPPTVVVRSNARAEEVLAGLLVWFDGQDRHSQVAVAIGGVHIGYLDREWLLQSSERVLRGFGRGDYAVLPGDILWEETMLYCPVEGCDYQLWVVCFDAADRVKCEKHDVDLVVATGN